MKKGDRIRLTKPYQPPMADAPIDPGKEGTILFIQSGAEWGLEDYITIKFDGASYFQCIPVSSLEVIPCK